MKAKDVMIPLKVYLMPGDGLREFVFAIREARAWEKTRGVRSLPVLEESGKLVGILSMLDILKAMHPYYLYETDLHLFTWDGMLESLSSKLKGKRVSDLMTREVITVQADHPLMECVDQMLKHRISVLPVTDHDDKPLGILYESDIFFAIADGLLGGK